MKVDTNRLVNILKNLYSGLKSEHLFFRIELSWRPPRKNYYRGNDLPVRTESSYVAHLRGLFERVISWCDEQSVHWAEIRTVELTKIIMTFDLAILAFVGAAQHLFADNLSPSVTALFAIISLVLLLLFLNTVTRKNINNIYDRSWIFRDALAGLNTNPEQAIENFNRETKENASDLKNHERIWVPIRAIGQYFFLASVVSAALGIVVLDFIQHLQS